MSEAAQDDICPRCGNPFRCGAADAQCACFDLELGKALRQTIARHYECCLCVNCLKALSSGAAIVLPA